MLTLEQLFHLTSEEVTALALEDFPKELLALTPDDVKQFTEDKKIRYYLLSSTYLKLSQSLPIERLVFSGGGAKGVVYPGVYRALSDAGMMAGVTDVSGSSAGSAVATLIAVGHSPDAVQKILDFDLTSLVGERVGRIWGSNPDGVRFFTRSSESGLNVIRKSMNDGIRFHLERLQQKLSRLNAKNHALAQKLASVLAKFAASSDPAITFGDLDVLHQVEPQHFKGLLVTATRHPDCKLTIFSAKTTPDLEIAKAVQASCSIPGVFEPVKIGSERFVDGGLMDNIPAEIFDMNGVEEAHHNHKKSQTLVFAFASGDPLDNPVFRATYGSNSKPYTVPWSGKLLLHGLPWVANLSPDTSLVEADEASYQMIFKNYPLRVCELTTAGLDMLDFEKATSAQRTMLAIGYFDAMMHIVNHDLQDRSTSFSFESDQLLEKMLSHFKSIYLAFLLGAEKDPCEDAFFCQLNELNKNVTAGAYFPRLVRGIQGSRAATRSLDSADKPRKVGSVEQCEQLHKNNAFTLARIQRLLDLIRSKVLEKIDSPVAFAFTRACERYHGKITDEDLFAETFDESLKHRDRPLAGHGLFNGKLIYLLAASGISRHFLSLFLSNHEYPDAKCVRLIFNALGYDPGFMAANHNVLELTFFERMLEYFKQVYSIVLMKANKDPVTDILLIEMEKINKPLHLTTRLDLIIKKSLEAPHSIAAFALSSALELYLARDHDHDHINRSVQAVINVEKKVSMQIHAKAMEHRSYGNMQILGGFMAVLGVLAVAAAFVALQVPLCGGVFALGCGLGGLALSLLGLVLFNLEKSVESITSDYCTEFTGLLSNFSPQSGR